jgi:hypothetical protein
MNQKPPRRAWLGWAFLLWTVIVLAAYVNQLLQQAAALGIRWLP